MKILRKLFGKKSEPQSLEDKIQNLDDQPQSSLEVIAQGGSGDANDIGLRVAATLRLSYDLVLRELAVSGAVPSEISKAARQRIAYFIDEGKVDVATIIEDIQDTEKLLAFAGFCKKVDLEAKIISSVRDQNILANLCLSSVSAAVRQSLATRIDSPELLKGLAKALKNKDKKAYKIIKTKLDGIKEEENKAAEIQRSIIHLGEEIEQHVQRFVDKDYVLRFERLQRRWQDTESYADESAANRFKRAAEQCKNNIQKYNDDLKAATEFERQVAKLDVDRKSLLDNLWALINKIYDLEVADDQALNEYRNSLEEQKKRWIELNGYGEPSSNVLRYYTLICEAADILLKEYSENEAMLECRNRASNKEGDEDKQREDIKYLYRLLHPIKSLKNFEAGENVKQTIAFLERINADHATQEESRQKEIRLLAGLIRKANQAAEQGRLKQAIGVRHSIDEKLASFDGLPGHLTRQLENLDESIQKLVDWQSYAVVPKKQALIEAMESLVGTDLPPEVLSTKIKKLQEDWKSLRQSGKDRQEDLWRKFSELADKAYEPCKKYNQELADTRKSNLEKRQQLVSQLTQFYSEYNWENADWKYIESILRTARNELHGYAPVDRAANKPVLDAFDAAMSAIQDKFNVQLEKNRAAKEQLIEQAKMLSDIADTQQARDSAKRLQAQWKKTGRCHYRDDDRLWKEFRSHCDVVFEKKAKQDADRKAAVDECLNEAKALIEKMQALNELPPEQLLNVRAEGAQLQEQFSKVEGVPERLLGAIQRDFNKAVERYDQKLKQADCNNEAQAWQTFFDACHKVNNYQSVVIENQEDDEDLRKEVESFLGAVKRWPEGGQAIINNKMASVSSDVNVLMDENFKALKLLCIRAEILADKESPEGDKALRMEYQMNLLKQGIGKAHDENAGIKIAKEWVEVGPVGKDVYQGLFERFYSSWSSLTA